MIVRFEEYTDQLTDYELKEVIPILKIGLLRKVGEEEAVSNRAMVDGLRSIGIKTSEPRIRHMIHILRVTGEVPRLVASSKGYYIATDTADIIEYIESLDQRIERIRRIRDALSRQIQ